MKSKLKMGKLHAATDGNIVRYANCWEDANVLLKGLAPNPGARILSIASAGDNSFSLLTTDPDLVVAVDINTVQLYLVALKRAAIQHLSYDDLLGFLGFTVCDDRLGLFRQIVHALTGDEQAYWERHLSKIAEGVIHQGKFERYFRLFARCVLPFIHSQHSVAQLLSEKDDLAQQQYYHKKWNTWRWRLLFRVFFSKTVMGRLGRDPSFLKEVDVHVASYIFRKAERHLKKVQAQVNPILRYNLTASFGDLLPHYLQPENFGKVKANLERLVLRQGYIDREAAVYGAFDSMNLSNIFEYMSRDVFRQTAQELLRSLCEGGKIAYWNLMVPRRISGIFPSEIAYLSGLSRALTDQDNGFFYNQFVVEQK